MKTEIYIYYFGILIQIIKDEYFIILIILNFCPIINIPPYFSPNRLGNLWLLQSNCETELRNFIPSTYNVDSLNLLKGNCFLTSGFPSPISSLV